MKVRDLLLGFVTGALVLFAVASIHDYVVQAHQKESALLLEQATCISDIVGVASDKEHNYKEPQYSQYKALDISDMKMDCRSFNVRYYNYDK